MGGSSIKSVGYTERKGRVSAGRAIVPDQTDLNYLVSASWCLPLGCLWRGSLTALQ